MNQIRRIATVRDDLIIDERRKEFERGDCAADAGGDDQRGGVIGVVDLKCKAAGSNRRLLFSPSALPRIDGAGMHLLRTHI